jgi:hypothetical protein
MVAGTQYVATTAGNVSRMTWGTAGSPRVIVMAVDVLEGNPRMMVALPEVNARGMVADAPDAGAAAVSSSTSSSTPVVMAHAAKGAEAVRA